MFFELKNNGEIIKSNITDEKIKSLIKIHKTDENDKPLSGVKIGIYDLDNKLVKTIITNEEGIAEIELEYGKYYYKEIETLESFVLNKEQFNFEVKKDGEILEYNLVNKKIKSLVKIHKTNNDNKALSGVVIGIYDEHGNEIGKYTTDDFGNIEVELEYGNYFYKEISTLEGLILDEKEHHFKVTENGIEMDFQLINEKIPITGVSDYKIVNMLSLIGITSGLGLIIYEKKKQ